jgi:hypothetical protein
MAKIPKKFSDRVAQRLKHYQGITAAQRTRDVSEADTVTVIKDILADIFGYDKYSELTSEQQIRGSFCDLAIKIDGKIKYLIEAKSAGLDLNESHLRQAVNYGANQGIEWIVLTNSIEWRVFKVIFNQPVAHEEVVTFSLANVSAQKDEDLECLFLLAREGIASDAISTFHQRAQLLNRFTVAHTIMTDSIVSALRRELRRLFPDLKVDQEQIAQILETEVLKREVLDGEKAKDAAARIKKAVQRLNRKVAKASEQAEARQ